MRIDPGTSNIPPASGRKPGRGPQRAFTSTAPSSSEQLSEAVSSAEIAPLMANLDEIVDVRMDLVEEVRERLNRGEFLSRDAADKTAAAILADLVSFIGQ